MEPERKGEHFQEGGNPRSTAGGCSPSRNYPWKFHHHCPKTPVNLLLTHLSSLLFGTGHQDHLAGQRGNDEHTQGKWVQKVPDSKR